MGEQAGWLGSGVEAGLGQRTRACWIIFVLGPHQGLQDVDFSPLGVAVAPVTIDLQEIVPGIDGRFRHVWRVVDGKVVQLDSYHDVERFRAFVQMAQGLLSA